MKCGPSLFCYYKHYILIPLLIIILLINLSCNLGPAQKPHISKLEATHLYVYPQGTTEIKCIATSPTGDNLIYKWSCTDGSIIGNGPIVTWKSPNKYGNFHIMITVEDSKGASDNATITISVVANKNQPACPSCGKK